MYHLQQTYLLNVILKSLSPYNLFIFRIVDGKDPVILADTEYPEFVLRLNQPVSTILYSRQRLLLSFLSHVFFV